MNDSDSAFRKLELDKCREELALLQTRFKVGEIDSDVFDSNSKVLFDRISMLEKEINSIPLSTGDRLKKHRALIVIIAAVALGLLLCGAIVLLVPRPGTGVGNISLISSCNSATTTQRHSVPSEARMSFWSSGTEISGTTVSSASTV